MNSLSLNRLQAGMSLVELMVAMVISLLGVIVIFQVYAVNEGVRRSTTQGSDTQTSGLQVLLRLERELRAAGYGINDFDVLGCTMTMYDNQSAPTTVPDFTLAPVRIVSNAGAVPDEINIIYGGVAQTSASVQLGTDMATVTDTVTLTYRFGFNTGDRFVIGQPTPLNTHCTLGEVNGRPGSIDLQHSTSAYVNSVTGQNASPRFNPAAGLITGVAYKYLVGKVMNLGQAPVRERITVDVNDPDPSKNNKLYVQNFWADAADPASQPLAVAEQVVAFKAEYGMDDQINNGTVQHAAYAADDNIVDNYVDSNAANAPNNLALTLAPGTSITKQQQGWQRVRSVRLAVVTRSLTPEKPLSGTTCDATPDYTDDANYQIRWARGPDAPTGKKIDVRTNTTNNTIDNWRCYKYQVRETVVPLRNVFWRQP
jgi:type IV pilus assembly protein PilW